MIAETVSFTWSLVFLGAAVVLFLLGCPHRLFAKSKAKGWFLPLGLACFAFAFFLQRFQ